MLNRILEGEDTSLGLGLITDIGILLSHTDHDALVAGTSDDGGEDSAGSVISSEAGLDHAGAIVNDQSGNVFVTHVGCEVSGVGGPTRVQPKSCGWTAPLPRQTDFIASKTRQESLPK